MTLGTILIVAGIFLYVLVLAFSAAKTGNFRAKGGAVVIVGPFPIIFGSDKQSAKILLILSIVLVSALLILFLVQGYF